jgi:hypothetical protein
MSKLALLLALLVLAAHAAPLRDALIHNRVRDLPTQAQLYPSCALSTDATTLNGMACTSEQTTLAVGCLDTHRAYTCDSGSWTWVVVTQ